MTIITLIKPIQVVMRQVLEIVMETPEDEQTRQSMIQKMADKED